MKTIYFARHAKSSWKHDVTDHQRPLKGRGCKDAPLVANYVASKLPAPQLLLSSDAVRAEKTAIYFKDAFQIAEKDFKVTNELYDFSGQQLMKVLYELPNDLHTVMIVGHNHALTSVVNMLGNSYIGNVSTSGFVAITFDTDQWNTISTGVTIKTVFPKELKE